VAAGNLGVSGSAAGLTTTTTGTGTTNFGATAVSGIGGNLLVTSAGVVGQTAATALTVTGASSITAIGKDVTLANAGNDFTGLATITSPNVTISDANVLNLALLGSGAQKVVVPNATELTMSSQSTALSVDFSAVNDKVSTTFVNATSLDLLGTGYNGLTLNLTYTPGNLAPGSVSVGGSTGAFYTIGARTTHVTEPAGGGVSKRFAFLGNNTLLNDINPQEQDRVTPALTSVLASAERDAQSQVAGIGQIVKRLKGNSIDMADLTASIEYKKQDINRAPCSVEQNSGEVVTPPRTCTER
jgi:hypothetical protein